MNKGEKEMFLQGNDESIPEARRSNDEARKTAEEVIEFAISEDEQPQQ